METFALLFEAVITCRESKGFLCLQIIQKISRKVGTTKSSFILGHWVANGSLKKLKRKENIRVESAEDSG